MVVENDRSWLRWFTMRSFVAIAMVRGYCEEISDTTKMGCNIEIDGVPSKTDLLKGKKTGNILFVPDSELDKKLDREKIRWLCEHFGIPQGEFDYVMEHLAESSADN